jgi:hypothetical protein
MITLRRGDRLPTVAVLQSYLNQQDSTVEFLEVDGIFGKKTERAVHAYRLQNLLGMGGAVDYAFWRAVVGREWQIVDSVDRTKPDDLEHEDLAPYRQTLLEQFGMSRGGRLVLHSVARSSRTGEVVLLRFHGHGSPGNMIVSSGVSSASSFDYTYGQDFFDALRELRSIFAPFGSVEMHGCRVGQGAPGRTLLTGMCNALGVPVTAGVQTQYGGGSSTFRFEGRTVTACPGAQPLKVWSSSVASVSAQRPAAAPFP